MKHRPPKLVNLSQTQAIWEYVEVYKSTANYKLLYDVRPLFTILYLAFYCNGNITTITLFLA